METIAWLSETPDGRIPSAMAASVSPRPTSTDAGRGAAGAAAGAGLAAGAGAGAAAAGAGAAAAGAEPCPAAARAWAAVRGAGAGAGAGAGVALAARGATGAVLLAPPSTALARPSCSPGGSSRKVYSRANLPEAQFNSTRRSTKGSLIGRDDEIRTTARPSDRRSIRKFNPL